MAALTKGIVHCLVRTLLALLPTGSLDSYPEHSCQDKGRFVLPLHGKLAVCFVAPSAGARNVQPSPRLLDEMAGDNIFERLAERCKPLQGALTYRGCPMVQLCVCELAVSDSLRSTQDPTSERKVDS